MVNAINHSQSIYSRASQSASRPLPFTLLRLGMRTNNSHHGNECNVIIIIIRYPPKYFFKIILCKSCLSHLESLGVGGGTAPATVNNNNNYKTLSRSKLRNGFPATRRNAFTIILPLSFSLSNISHRGIINPSTDMINHVSHQHHHLRFGLR